MARGWVLLLACGCGSLTHYDKPDSGATDSGDDPPPVVDTAGPIDSSFDPGDDDDDDDDDDDSGTWWDPTETGCVYPDTSVTPSGPPQFQMYYPWFVGLTFYGVASDGAIYDYDAGGTPYSAVVVFTFLDYYGYPMCDIVYDADLAQPATAVWSTDSGGALFERYELVLADGASTCGSVYGGIDLRTLVEAVPWGIGFGQLVGLAGFLQDLVEDDGQDWATAWAPYTYAMYVEGGIASYPGTAVEAGWATSLDRDCGDIFVDAYGAGTPLPAPTSGPLDHYINAHPLVIFYLPPL